MDTNSESGLGESSQSARHGYTINSSAVNNSSSHVLSVICVFCHRILSSDNDTSHLDAINVCGDCKFLLLEDLETTSPDMYPRRLSRRRYDSSESMESMFSQQFSQLINLARQNQSTVFDRDYQSVDGDEDAARLVQHTTSSRTTPSGSRRWRRVFSDTESDGLDSLYSESESNVSFRRYSYSVYGGDSDASVDGQSFMENENFGRPNGESDFESDTDIDPMNAGYQWNSEDEDDSEWEEADIERNTHTLHNNWRRQFLSREVEAIFIHERIQARTGDLLTNFEDSRGAPPASASFINNMPCVTINEDEVDSMVCAICKESFTVGTVVNRLPCFHLFHSLCILPWLRTRNTCPLCRHEVPTDDTDYETRKRNVGGDGYETRHVRQRDVNYDVIANEEQSEVGNEDSVGGNGVARDVTRNKWLFLAAPIVGIVGITLMLCFGNTSLQDRRCGHGRIPGRGENSQLRRGWWFF